MRRIVMMECAFKYQESVTEKKKKVKLKCTLYRPYGP
jgi:hypothetical protein